VAGGWFQRRRLGVLFLEALGGLRRAGEGIRGWGVKIALERASGGNLVDCEAFRGLEEGARSHPRWKNGSRGGPKLEFSQGYTRVPHL